MAQTTSLPTVINLLLQKLQTVGAGLSVGGSPVNVYDGPEGPDQDDNFAVVMADPDEPDTDNDQEWAALGSLAMYENYDIIVTSFAYVGGDDSTATYGANDAQLSARTNVFTIDNAFVVAVFADLNLATQAGGPAPIIWCRPGGFTYGQMPPDEESGMGRYAFVRRRYHVYNRLSGH